MATARLQRLRTAVEPLLARLAHRFQMQRLRVERWIDGLPGRRGRLRVLATACWDFPIYSQTFVYQELTQLIRHGARVRFLYSHLQSRKHLASQFNPLWHARRLLLLHPSVAAQEYDYYNSRMPKRVADLVTLLSRSSGLSPEAIQQHRHFRQAFAFTRLVEAYGPDYLHSYFFYEGTLFSLCASYLLDIPRGVSCYADHMLDDYDLKLVSLHLAQCGLVIATSARIKGELGQIAPQASLEHVLVKPNGINPAHFPVTPKTEPRNGQPYRLVCVSRIEPKKGLIHLAEAVGVLRERGCNVEAHVLGAPDNTSASLEYAAALQSRIGALALGELVHLEGRQTEAEIRRHFARSHLYVAPFVETESGDKDGIPTSLLEGMSSGLPVVATNAGSITEVIEDEQDGLLVSQRDPIALADAIEGLLRDPVRRAQLGREAGATIRRRFDANICEAAFYNQVRALISRSRGRGTKPDLSYPERPVNPWTKLSLPSALTGMRSMLSKEEKQYLIWLTAEIYEGWGAVIDLGPWLGSSSAALAEGLKRTHKQGKIQSFDLFQWEWEPSYMEAVAHEQLKGGEDFLPVFLKEIGPYAPWIDAHKQDLMQYSWEGGPIEILFVDAAKSWELANAIFKGFGPHLVPGRSRVVLQDFRYHETHWLPLIFDSRPDLWKELEGVADGTTVTFVPLKPLDGPAGIHADYSEEAFPVRSAEHLLRSRIARESGPNKGLFLRSLYRKIVAEGSPGDADAVQGELDAEAQRALQEELRAAGVSPDEIEQLEAAWTLIVPLGWKAYNRHDFRTAQRLAERCLARKDDRPVYAVVLLGMALLRQGDLPGARRCLDEVIARLPDYLPASLYRAELELAEGRPREAEVDALRTLRGSRGDELHISYGLRVLEQAWGGEDRGDHALATLTGLSEAIGDSPAFLAALARTQFRLGRRAEALESVDAALRIAPGDEVATSLREEWANG